MTVGVIDADCSSDNSYSSTTVRIYLHPTVTYILQISCCSNGVPQSNTTVYIAPLATSVVPGLVAVMKAFEWTQAAIITEEIGPYMEVCTT